jgi:hypothetical protein
MSTCRSARRNTTAPDLESEPDHAPLPVKSPKPNKGRKQIQSNADEVESKCKKKDEQDNNDTGNDSGNNSAGGEDMSGDLGGMAQGSRRGGKATMSRGKGGKRGGKGKKR